MQTFDKVSPDESPGPRLQHTDLTTPSNPADDLISDSEWLALSRLLELSSRESDVARLLFSGMSREQIALSLCKADGSSLSPETVRVYIDRLWRKLNVTNHMQLAIRLLRVQRLIQQG